MGTRVETGSRHAVVTIEGDLDVAQTPAIRSMIHRTLDDGWTGIVLDLTECSVIDSAGLGVIIGTHRRCKTAGGKLELVVPFDHLRRILRAADLDRIFDFHATLADAAHAVDDAAEGVA